MYVELDEAERITYDAIRAATQREIVALLQAGGGVMAALEALLRLRQAACHPALLPMAVRGGAAPQQSSKLERLMEALEDAVADGHRALVFSQWTSLLDLIEPHLEAAGFGFVRLDGTTIDRAGVVATFQADTGPPVMLLSLKAGGTGLNLTAADHVFLVDPWWNPAVEDQAADRTHRIGQDKPVMVYRMVRARHRRGAHPRAPGPQARPSPTPRYPMPAARPRSRATICSPCWHSLPGRTRIPAGTARPRPASGRTPTRTLPTLPRTASGQNARTRAGDASLGPSLIC